LEGASLALPLARKDEPPPSGRLHRLPRPNLSRVFSSFSSFLFISLHSACLGEPAPLAPTVRGFLGRTGSAHRFSERDLTRSARISPYYAYSAARPGPHGRGGRP
jgi:hypothetical protein